jgi:hypothetical protein
VGVLVEQCALGCELYDEDGEGGAEPEPQCKPCEPGEVGCYDDRLVECDASGEPLSITPCPFGCDGGRSACDECRPATRQCHEGDVRVDCSSDGLIEDQQSCDYACLEEAGEGRCTDCHPGITHCEQGDEITCDAQGRVASRQVCEYGCNVNTGRCNECVPGQEACQDGNRIACNVDGEITFSQSCAYGCNADRVECNECVPSQTACDGDTLVTCDADGYIDGTRHCALGCLAAEQRCYTFTPTNLTSADLEAGTTGLLAADPSDTVVIDTGSCSVAVNGADVTPPAARTTSMGNGFSLCVLPFDGVLLYSPVTVSGNRGLALLARGQIVLHDLMDASGHLHQPGPGGASSGDGFAANGGTPDCTQFTGGGGGGGGHAGAGGSGGTSSTNPVLPGGAGGGEITDPGLSPIYPGGAGGECPGRPDTGGGGGGGIILAAGRSIQIVTAGTQQGRVDASGGGGAFGGGGGAGGSIILEAPEITVGGVVAARGGGGGCAGQAQDGREGGAGCSAGAPGGDGGASQSRPNALSGENGDTGSQAGGGGGAAGRILIRVGPAQGTPAINGSLHPPAATGAVVIGTLTPI